MYRPTSTGDSSTKDFGVGSRSLVNSKFPCSCSESLFNELPLFDLNATTRLSFPVLPCYHSAFLPNCIKDSHHLSWNSFP
ncbi:Lipase_GDSL domain-containing protein [Psidium guajava]|nr:Lipase_GDSL domain-containing protein [Psidium guajava]